MLKVAFASGASAVELMFSELTSRVSFGPAFVLIDFTSDNGEAMPQRLTAAIAT